MEEKIINLSEDSKVVCLKSLKDINGQLGFMFDLIKKNGLTEEMRDTLCGLFEFSMSDISKHVGYNGESARKVEERHAQIREANQKIRELEKKIGSEDLTEKLPAQIKYLADLIEKWWDIDGFNYIKEIFVRPYGSIEVNFGFSFNEFRSMYSDKPVTVKEAFKAWIEEVENKGFKLYKERHDIELLDNDENRKLVTDLIKKRFPSADIIEWNNYSCGKYGLFQIRYARVIIRNLFEVKALEEYVRKFKEVDEE